MKNLVKQSKPCLLMCTLAFLVGQAPSLWSQSVQVTMSLDSNVIVVGETTQLRVHAQVVSNLQANAERIFSWYIDLLNSDGTIASADYDAMLHPTSDNDPVTSSTGTDDGDDRRGIFDTFLNLPGAGVAAPVELLSVPVTGTSAGVVDFSAAAGTGQPLSADFLVALIGQVDPGTGGDYAQASAQLTVNTACSPQDLNLQISRVGLGGPGEALTLTFTPCPGLTHTVEFSDTVDAAANWMAVPGGPHDSGSVTITNTVANRFFRVRAD